MSNRKSKPIPFNLTNKRDIKLLEYAEKQDIAFASYIKNLIEKDMVKQAEQVENIEKNYKTKIDEVELKNMLKKVLKELSIDKADEEIKTTNTQKSSIKSLLKNLNK